MKSMMQNIGRTCLLLLSVITMTAAQAQGPNQTGSYYKNADGLTGPQLKTALFNIIKNPSVVSYAKLIEAYRQTDTRTDGYVRDWYSNITNYRHDTDKAGNYRQEGDVYNREHTVPQSWFSKASPMRSDIVHVVPTDGYVNGQRSDYPFAEVGKVTYESANGYSKLGYSVTEGYSGIVFEPNDEVKGDLARIYFYMATCYENLCTGWGNRVFSSDKAQGLEPWVLKMMMRWSKTDPVDDVERARNEAVYQIQKNRNPYVDYPGLEDYVWGSKNTQPFSYDHYEGTTEPEEVVVGIAAILGRSGSTSTSGLSKTTRKRQAVYNLSGQRVSKSQQKAGVYVKNKRKMVRK